jgi:sporulation-control protein spo0M
MATRVDAIARWTVAAAASPIRSNDAIAALTKLARRARRVSAVNFAVTPEKVVGHVHVHNGAVAQFVAAISENTSHPFVGPRSASDGQHETHQRTAHRSNQRFHGSMTGQVDESVVKHM